MKKKLLALAAAAVLGGMGTSASASVLTYPFPDFTINETFVPDSTGNPALVADKINGGYTEKLTVSGTGGFNASAYIDFGAYFGNGGTTIVSGQLGCSITPNCYNLYGVFKSVGQVVSSTIFQGSSGEFYFYLDPSQNTTKTLVDAFTLATLGNTGDDILLASSTSLTFGVGTTISPTAFEFKFDPQSLTAAGSAFFVGPTPFYAVAQIDGNVIGAPNPIAPGNYNVTGAGNVSFNVPEPGSLALLGLSLAGLGLLQRRRKSAR